MNKTKTVVVEIRGVGFVNKGAELMLQAIKQKFLQHKSGAKLVMEVDYSKGLSNAEKEARRVRKEGLYIKPAGRWKKINVSFLFNLLPKSWRQKNKILLETEIDVVLDGSGFAFGDSWGADFAKRRLTNNIAKWSSQGKKIILLPQAFGPFEDPAVLKEIQTVGKYSNLIFARDPVSYQNLVKALPSHKNVVQYPDFTNLLICDAPNDFDMNSHEVAIIPNFKMGNVVGGIEAYKTLLVNVIAIIRKQKYKPFFLIHEGVKDEAIADEVNSLITVPVPVVRNRTAKEIKGIIGVCHAVVTSRFHGLVSALSQGVPCLATTWSHKYKMLMADYRYTEGLIDDLSIDHHLLENKINLILTPESNETIRVHLLLEAERQKSLSVKMWDTVFSNLSERKN